MKLIPHSRPWITADDARAVARVVRSGRLSQGEEVRALEREMAARTGYRHGVAVSSGSAALHLALRVLGVGEGHEVVLPSYLCAAALHAVQYVGAEPRLVDLAPGGFHPDPRQYREALGRRGRVVIRPHLFGFRAADEGLSRAGVPVVEDVAMAAGLDLPRRSRGRLAVTSFYATKPLAGGEGGMLLTDSARLADELRDLRSYDKKARPRLRFNYKLTEMQAALVRSQLSRLAKVLEQRRRLARGYFEGLNGCPRLLLPPRDAEATWYRFVARSSLPLAPLIEAYARLGIEVARPVHRPLHRLLGLDRRAFPETESAYLTAISLPIYPRLAPRESKRVISATWRIHADSAASRRRLSRRRESV